MDPAGLSIKGLIIMYTGFFGYIGFTLLFIFKGFDAEGKPILKNALTFLGLIFVFFFLWIIGLIYL